MISRLTNIKIHLAKIFIPLFLFTSVPMLSQTAKFDSLITVGINEIYNIKFDKAVKTFSVLEKEYPEHPAGKFFDAMIIWWKIVLDQDSEKYDEIFEDKLEAVIDFCDDILDEDENNVDAIFFKGGSLGFRGRLYSLRKDWFDAALDGKDALPLVYQAFNIDSTNEDVKLGFGIYNYYAEAIPEKYPFIKPAMIFFPDGDKEKGIRQLQSAAENAKYAAIESQFFLMNLYYQFENDFDKSLEYAQILNSRFPDNPIFQKYVGRIFVKKGDYTKASVIFENIKRKSESKMMGYDDNLLRESNYYLGVYQLGKNKIELAKSSFTNCFEISKKLDKEKDEESGFMINAALYLCKIYSQEENYDLANKYYELTMDMREYSNSHKKAKKYISKLNKKKAGD